MTSLLSSYKAYRMLKKAFLSKLVQKMFKVSFFITLANIAIDIV